MSKVTPFLYAMDVSEGADGTPLGPMDRWIFFNLCRFCDDEGRCWPSVRKMMKRTSASDRTIREATALFVKLGMVKKFKRFRSDGSRTSNGYLVVLPDAMGRAVDPTSVDIPTNWSPFASRHADDTPPAPDAEGDEGVTWEPLHEAQGGAARGAGHELLTLTTQKEEPPLPPESRGEPSAQQGPVTKLEDAPAVTKRGRVRNGTVKSLEGFELFYSLYPLKVGEGQAEKNWPKAVKDAGGDYMVIIDGLNARLHLLLEQKARGKLWHPATWLSGRRWKDAIEGVEDEDETALPLLTGGKG